MSEHDAWSLICRLFTIGVPVFRVTMAPQEIVVLPLLERAVRPALLDAQFVLCPRCKQHRPRICSDGCGGRLCECPRCGWLPVTSDDVAAFVLDEDWLRRQLRVALSVDGRDGIDALGDDVWRLGGAHRAPVLLARSLLRLWSEPAMLDRVRVAGSDTRVVTPRPLQTRGAPFGAGAQWLALEDRFALRGGRVIFAEPPCPAETAPAVNPAAPVHGPFSADFRWVTLPGENEAPIACTAGQAAVFRALWAFQGVPRTTDEVMRRAGLDSQRPVDLFKGPKNVEAARAYRALVVTQQRPGLYSMPCAARPAST